MATAKDFFHDNILRFASNPNTEPEKYNFYQGLYVLAQDIENLHHDIEQCKQMLLALTKHLSR